LFVLTHRGPKNWVGAEEELLVGGIASASIRPLRHDTPAALAHRPGSSAPTAIRANAIATSPASSDRWWEQLDEFLDTIVEDVAEIGVARCALL
jgi:hypothetical protein